MTWEVGVHPSRKTDGDINQELLAIEGVIEDEEEAKCLLYKFSYW